MSVIRQTYDSARSTESVGGEVGSELGLDDTRVTVRPRDSAPHDSDLGTVDFSLGLVDVGDSLEMKGMYQLCIFWVCTGAVACVASPIQS